MRVTGKAMRAAVTPVVDDTSTSIVLTREVTDVVCDVCGKSTKQGDDEFSDFEYGTLHASFGYESKRDGDTVHLDLCEECFGKVEAFVNTLKAP